MKTAFLALLAVSAFGQQLDLSSLDKFASKASETSNVSLDADKLKMAGQFLSDNKGKDEKTKQFLNSMKGVFVRTFEFDTAGVVSSADLEPIRQQLRAPGWAKAVEVKEKDETVEVYFFTKGNQPGGLAVITHEPKELVVVNLVGAIDLNALAGMAGSFGIPSGVVPGKSPSTSSPQKDDDDDN